MSDGYAFVGFYLLIYSGYLEDKVSSRERMENGVWRGPVQSHAT